MSIVQDSPSAGRRKALKEADAANQLRMLGSCPLSKYMDIADRLLDHFQDAVDGRRFDEAYVFGLRFANLSLSSLPQHPEWKHDTSSKGRKRLTSQVGDVLCMMDVIKQRMDAEELVKIKKEIIAKKEEEFRMKEAEDRRKYRLDEARQREQKICDALEEERAQFLVEQRPQRQEEIKQKKTLKKKNVEKSAMAKLQAMQARMSSVEEHTYLSEEMVAASKKNIAPSKSNQAQAKEGSTPKNWFSGGKKQSNLKSKEEKAILSSSCPTRPYGIKDNTNTATLLASSIAEENVIKTKIAPDSIAEQYDRDQSLEPKSSLGEHNEKKTMIVTSAENQESKIESSFDTASTRSTVKSKKKDSDSTRSMKSKESIPISFIKSKIVAAKPSISMLPSAIEVSLPFVKTSMNGCDNNTTATIIAAQQTPRSRKEKATIDKLKSAISAQEDRLEDIEGKKIPFLLHAAKTFLKEDNKREALKCLAHKKRLERQVDTIKAAVFNMETQMFMLESAFEDRYVKKALDEAAIAIAGFQQNIGDPTADVMDLTNMSASFPELDVGDSTDEELMEELGEWLSPEEKRKSQEKKNSCADGDGISLLSMPAFLPEPPVATLSSPSVDRIVNAGVLEG